MPQPTRKTPLKTIYTCLREVDVSNYLPIVEHPIFLRLGEKSQTGCGYKEFPGGRQSRLEHSIIVYHFMDELCKELLKKACITEEQVNDLKIAALLHDIGHAPFSHFIGRLLGYFIDPIVAKKTPESSLISHHTLGVDKISYSLADGRHTGYLLDAPYFLDMFDRIFYENGEIGISDEKGMIRRVKRVQHLIQDMYIDVYFNENVKQFERVVEKAVELEIRSIDHPKKLTPEMVWYMSEGALLHGLRNSDDSDVRQLLRRYSRNELYETVIEFKIKKKGRRNVVENNGKIQEFVSKDVSNVFIKKYRNPSNLTKLERKMSDATGVPFIDLMITLSADPKRIMPDDIAIYTPQGQKKGTLFEMDPDHCNSLIEKAENFFALKIHVDKKFKDHFTTKSEVVKRIIEEDVKK